jgi:hypothetical protein
VLRTIVADEGKFPKNGSLSKRLKIGVGFCLLSGPFLISGVFPPSTDVLRLYQIVFVYPTVLGVAKWQDK